MLKSYTVFKTSNTFLILKIKKKHAMWGLGVFKYFILIWYNSRLPEKLQREYRQFLYSLHPVSPDVIIDRTAVHLSKLRNRHWYSTIN